MKKLAETNVLICGIKGLGLEIGALRPHTCTATPAIYCLLFLLFISRCGCVALAFPVVVERY
jgi:hypothetical protein